MEPPTFGFIGGHVAVDLVNTVDWRLDPNQSSEQLTDFWAVIEWSRQAGLLATEELDQLERDVLAHPRISAAELAAVLDLRETTYAVLTDQAVSAGHRIALAYAEGLSRAELAWRGGHWAWEDRALTLRSPRDRIVRAVVDLLTAPGGVDRLHQCEDAACGWIYLDTSPRRNRRWCSSADCGNRNRVRRHYRRHNQG